ncbi:hypothetical protein ACI48D_14610 [Massilia sp. LXY-6]|uniref:hypothetical protein n=1 Tax=Massilia sp. LXY-6 TaxID=3379823 RepID=UPI003EDF21DA
MNGFIGGLTAIGVCLLAVGWQEYRRLNRRDGTLMAAAGACVVAGDAALFLLAS